jgi:phosphocarrier protein FPr
MDSVTKAARLRPHPRRRRLPRISEPPPRPRSSDPNVLLGVAASPGLAVGTVFQVQRAEIVVVEAGHGVEREQKLLAGRHRQGAWPARSLARAAPLQGRPAKAAIFAAHAELLDDPDFLEIASSAIAKGKSAAFAWKHATELHADRLRFAAE